jgi:hypothetical protein
MFFFYMSLFITLSAWCITLAAAIDKLKDRVSQLEREKEAKP